MNHSKLAALLIIIAGVARAAEGVPAVDADRGTRCQIAVREGRLSAFVRGMPLDGMLSCLAVALGARVKSVGGADDHSVDVEFANLSIEDGIERLLRPRSYALALGQGNTLRLRILGRSGGASVVVTARQVRPGTGSGDEARSAERVRDERTLTEVHTLLAVPEPGLRTRRIQDAMRGRTSTQVAGLLDGVLEAESDGLVREGALAAAAERTELPLGRLVEIATNDPDMFTRTTAIELLRARGLDDFEARSALTELAHGLDEPSLRDLAADAETRIERARALPSPTFDPTTLHLPKPPRQRRG